MLLMIISWGMPILVVFEHSVLHEGEYSKNNVTCADKKTGIGAILMSIQH